MILLHLQWSHFAAHPHNASSRSQLFLNKSETIIVFLYFPTFPRVPPSSELMRVWCSSLTFFRVISFWEIWVESRLHLSCSSSSSCPVKLGTKGNTHTMCLSPCFATCLQMTSKLWRLSLFYLLSTSDDSWACWDSSTKILGLVLPSFCSFSTLRTTWTLKNNKEKQIN